MKILDCTLRDGGYYTHWNFNRATTEAYLKALDRLPVDYIEIGYRQRPASEYIGEYGYTPLHTIEHVRCRTSKKLAVMVNEKDTSPDDLPTLVKPLQGLVDMVRIAVAPENITRATHLCEKLKDYGMEVAFNVMYMSKWTNLDGFYNTLEGLGQNIDMLTMVDSYGSVTPMDVSNIVGQLKARVGCRLAFHGHNNLQLALINTVAAIANGVDMVDATVLGMGRGAGNLNTELLLTWLNHDGLDVDFTALGDAVAAFLPLYEKYRWGTQLPYMISGANSLPQKEVMALVTNRVYSFESIVKGLQNRKDGLPDNAKYPPLADEHHENVLIVGGGVTAVEHIDAIHDFVTRQNDVALVFATARHCALFALFDCPKYYCLLGREAKRLAANATKPFLDKCVLPPYPRKLGTEVPDFAEGRTFELPDISFTSRYQDSCTTLAIETALRLSPKAIYAVGYDGYGAGVYSEKEIALSMENRAIFDDVRRSTGKQIVSLTPTLYGELDVRSVYSFLN